MDLDGEALEAIRSCVHQRATLEFTVSGDSLRAICPDCGKMTQWEHHGSRYEHLKLLRGENMTEPETTTAQTIEPDPFRVEIKENSKGEPSISVRATAKTEEEAVSKAAAMYKNTRVQLGLEG